MPFPRHLTKQWGKEIGWKCMSCGKRWIDGWCLESHHKTPTHNNGQDTRDNWQLLCIMCHERAHRVLAEADLLSASLVHARLVRTGGRWK